MNYTCWFSEIKAADTNLVGDIGKNLHRRVVGGLPTAPGFCITTNAYSYLMKVTGLNETITGLVEEANWDDGEKVEEVAAAIRDLIEEQPIPSEIASEVLEHYFKLGQQLGYKHLEALPVSVRPSIIAAGPSQAPASDQLGAYLNVQGGYSTLKHARLCWASVWNTQAVKHLLHNDIDPHKVKVAVVIQAMDIPAATQIYSEVHTFA